MMLNWVLRGFILATAAGLAGCGPTGRIKEETIEVKAQPALERAKKLLEAYAKGQPLGSEVTTYPSLVEEVKAEDAGHGATLEQGFAELEKTKGAATAAKAKEILQKFAPKAYE